MHKYVDELWAELGKAAAWCGQFANKTLNTHRAIGPASNFPQQTRRVFPGSFTQFFESTTTVKSDLYPQTTGLTKTTTFLNNG